MRGLSIGAEGNMDQVLNPCNTVVPCTTDNRDYLALNLNEPDESRSPSYANGAISARIPAMLQDLLDPQFLAKIMHSNYYIALDACILVVVLFINSFTLLMDMPDNPSVGVVDFLMCISMMFFGLDMAMKTLVERRGYPLSFFFWCDIMGTLSIAGEISFLLGRAGKIEMHTTGGDAMMVRMTRAARLGARAGRLSRIQRCLPLIFPRGETEALSEKARMAGATVLGGRLNKQLSTKVAILTMTLVLGMPVFQVGRFPEDDFSMRSWSMKLEADYARTYRAIRRNSTDEDMHLMFESTVQDMMAVYAVMDYYPYSLEGYPPIVTDDLGISALVMGSQLVSGKVPVRKQNIVKVVAEYCQFSRPHCEGRETAAIYFDFTAPHQYSEGLDVALVLFIIAILCFESFDFNKCIDEMVVAPLNKMMATARSTSELLNQVLPEQHESESVDGEDDRLDETEIIQKIFKRLAKVTEGLMQKKTVAEHDLANLDDESKGVIKDLLNYETVARAKLRRSRYSQGGRKSVLGSPRLSPADQLQLAPPIPAERIMSWDLNVLDCDDKDLNKVINYICLQSEVGEMCGAAMIEQEVFDRFVDRISAGYLPNQYHNYAHAVDILGAVCRLLVLLQWDRWLMDVDANALLIAALAHDLGHVGRTNVFLIEVGDDLALTYNDESPLENMHAAKLFEICRQPESNVFVRLERPAYKQSRKVCIKSILHTDNALHFEMVKELSMMYEVDSMMCDQQSTNPRQLDEQYVEGFLTKHTETLLQLMLHLADVSQPFKSFPVSKLWSWRVIEEFFEQGDDEKRLGLPVGMLNDRDKVNRIGSQHGFINFLVAPLVIVAVKGLPMMLPLAEAMVTSMEDYKMQWQVDSKPEADAVKTRVADIEKLRNQIDGLRRRHV